MPRPHPNGEALHVGEGPLVRALEHLDLPGVRRTTDGRVVVSDPCGLGHWWVGPDLTCLCSYTDDPCRHQLLAALAAGRPVRVPRAVHRAEMLPTLRSRLQRLPAAAVADCTPPGLISSEALFFSIRRALTEPGASEGEVLAALDRVPPEAAHLVADIALSLPHGRREGAVHERAADSTFAHLTSSTGGIIGVRRLQRLLDVAPDAAFVRHLTAAQGSAPRHLALVLATEPAVAVRAATLPNSSHLSALLADPALSPEARRTLARHLAARPRVPAPGVR